MSKGLIALVLAIFVSIGAYFLNGGVIGTQNSNHHTVPNGQFGAIIIDVGEGDSQLIVTPNRKTMLVDTGDNSERQSLTNINQVLSDNNIKTLDYLLITHPHQDHIGNIMQILQTYNPHHIVLTGVTYTNQTYERALQYVKDHQIDAIKASAGGSLDVDTGVQTQFFEPASLDQKNVNNTSIVTKVTYGDFSIILTGDAEQEEEADEVSKYGSQLQATVLKAGHHGSHTSTTEEYLKTVNPQWVVISAGKGNPYHHPHPSVIDRLKSLNLRTLVTMDTGSVIFVSDGKTYTEAQDR